VTADADGAKRDPLEVDVPQALEMAVQFHRQGWLEPAEEFYRAVLRLQPGEPNALHYLGVLLHQTGKSDAAVALLQEAIAARPDWADAYNNLGNILKESDRIDEAAFAYARAAELEPHNPTVLNNLGVVLKALDRGDEAEALLRRATTLAPNHAEAWFNLGNLLMRKGRVEEAADMLQTAVKLKPGRRGAWNRLVQILGRLGRKDDARRVFAEWLAFKPDDDSARHLKAAILGEGDAPERADDGYVRDVFGGFAEDFDERLATLRYRAPELVAGAIDRLVPPDRTKLAVLDAGAGTGLCGRLLKPRAARLIGVDLSKEMLAFAERRGVYDALHEAELTSWLATTEERFDLAVCADTLCYFGVLDDVLRGFAHALAPGGLLVFTVERSPEGDTGPYRLQYHGRYSHNDTYVREALLTAGFRVRALDQETLRMELGEPVVGLLAVAERP
jgi:predicted TPR repeat methyltransferase